VLAEAIVMGIGGGGPVLPADLQLAGIAMRDLRISSAPALQKLGGPSELEEAWLMEACRATGNERSALRLLSELADGPPRPHPADQVIRRINLDSAYAQQALTVLEQRGVITRGDQSGMTWMLRHEVLTHRVRELTAPARAAARRAFDLLGSKTRNRSRLKISELIALRHEGIAPATPAEIDVVQRSKRYYLTIIAGVAAVPLVIIIIMWISLKGRVYFDLTPRAGGDHIVVRSGRAGLSSFFWLPGGWGDEVADTLHRPRARRDPRGRGRRGFRAPRREPAIRLFARPRYPVHFGRRRHQAVYERTTALQGTFGGDGEGAWRLPGAHRHPLPHRLYDADRRLDPANLSFACHHRLTIAACSRAPPMNSGGL
jgi:hypothetical protein